MSLFAKSVFGYDMSLETDLTENYYSTINDAMEESQLLTENYSLSREVLQEGVMDSIKNLFLKAWEGIKTFFNYIIKKIGNFINYIKSLFSKKKNEKNEETSNNKKEAGKKSINEPAPGIPVKMEVKRAEEAVVAARQEVSKAKTPEAKKAAEKKVEQARANLEKVKKEVNAAKSSYKQDQKHDYQVNPESLKNHANEQKQRTNQIRVGERHFVVKNYLDMDKFDYKGAVGKLNRLNFEAMSLLTRRADGENVKINAEFSKRVKKEVAAFISDIESKVVDEQEITISINYINEYLKKLTEYKEAGEFCKSIIDKYDGNVQEIAKKAGGGSGSNHVSWYADIIKRVLITPFNKLANLISHSSTALGQQIVKFLNPNAKPVSEE